MLLGSQNNQDGLPPALAAKHGAASASRQLHVVDEKCSVRKWEGEDIKKNVPFLAEDREDVDVIAVATLAGSLLFCVEVNEGMLSAFFFSWCLQRGLSFALVGRSMGFLAVGILCMAPAAPSVILRFGPHRVLYYASWSFVLVRSCYVLLPITPVTILYPAMCALYFCMGLVAVLSESAALAWTLTSAAPSKRLQGIGILIGTRSAANIIAPALGGTLYSLGGFHLPIITGALVFALVLIVKRKRLLAKAFTVNTRGANAGSILRSRRVCVCHLISLTVMISLCSCVILFQAYLQSEYGLSAWKYGIMISSSSCIFIGGDFIAARMESAFGSKVPLFVGSVSLSAGLLLFGPSPYLPFLPAPGPSSVWLPCLALVLSFFGFSLIFSIISPTTLQYALRDGWSENDAAAQYGTLNALFGGCVVGLGGSFGGFLADAMGVAATTSLFAITLPIVVACALALLSYWDMVADMHQILSTPCSRFLAPKESHDFLIFLD